MNSLTVVDIRVFNLNSFMLRIINSGIYLEKISYNSNYIYIFVELACNKGQFFFGKEKIKNHFSKSKNNGGVLL